ncbi:MAG TPA: DegV family protein [Candidatus Dormibacteraeota bacterium]
MGAARCGLVVDSGAALPLDLLAAATVVPLRVEVGGELLREGIDIGTEELQRRLDGGEVAHSSTPSPGDYLEAMRASSARSLVVLTMAASLSGMHSAATLAARLLADEGDPRRVVVIDTGAAAMGLGVVARVGAQLCRDGGDFAGVSERVRRAGAEHTMLGTLRTLAPLARSGRLPALLAGLGDRLHIRPVFELREGRGRRLALCRSEAAVLRTLEREAVARAGGWEGVWLLVFHSGAADDAAALRNALAPRLPVVRSETVVLPAVASAYTGRDMVGVALVPLRNGELQPPD